MKSYNLCRRDHGSGQGILLVSSRTASLRPFYLAAYTVTVQQTFLVSGRNNVSFAVDIVVVNKAMLKLRAENSVAEGQRPQKSGLASTHDRVKPHLEGLR